MDLVEIELVRAHCYAPGSHDDILLQTYAQAAEQKVQDFLNRKVYADADSMAAAVLEGSAGDDPMIVNAAIKAAILLETGHLYRNREEVITGTIVAEMKEGSRSLLWPHRVGLGV